MAHGLPVTLRRNLKKESMYTFKPCEYGPQEQQPFHTSARWWLFICGFKTGKLKLGHKHFPTSCAGNVFQKSSKVMLLNRQQKIATLETLQVRWQGALSPSMKIRQSSLLPFRDDARAIHKHRLAGTARIFPYVTKEFAGGAAPFTSCCAGSVTGEMLSEQLWWQKVGAVHGSPRHRARSHPCTCELSCPGGTQDLCWAATGPSSPSHAGITLQLSTVGAGCANSVHNPVSALANMKLARASWDRQPG